MASHESTTLSGSGQRASSQLATIAVLTLAIAALYYGRDILIPVALAALLAFALEPLATRLRRTGLGRVASVVTVVALVLAIVGALGVLITDRALNLAENVPAYQYNVQRKIQALRGAPGDEGVIDKAQSALKEIEKEISKPTPQEEAAKVAKDGPPVAVRVEPTQPTTLQMLRDMAMPVLAPLGTAGLVIVFLVFMLLEREEIRDRFIRLVGGREIDVATQALGEASDRVSRFLLMQLIVNASYGIPIGIGLYLIGVPNALLWGVLAGLLRFVPYVGPFVAALFPIALAIAVDPGWSMALMTVALFLVVELVSNNVVEPWLYGPSTGLSAVAIILAAIFWTTLWGPAGLLLSTPLTVCLVVLGRHVPQLRFLYVILGSAPALTPAQRFYQRMLAGDTAEGEEIAADYIAEHGVAAFHDDVLVPALRHAEADRRRETLAPERADAVAASVRLVLDALPEADDDADDAQREPAPRATVLCIGGRGPLDMAAADLLVRRLAQRRVPASLDTPDTLTAERIVALEKDGIAAVALVHLGPSAVAHSRHLARRLRKASRVAVVAVLLDEQLRFPVADDELKAMHASAATDTLESAAQWLEGAATGAPAQPMVPAPVPQNEDERLAALERLDVLDTPTEASYDRYTGRLKEAFDVPIALVSLVDGRRQWWKSAQGLPPSLDRAREAPRETSICGHVVANDETLVVEDVLRDERFAGNPFLREHGIRFYAGAPLRTDDGLPVGSLCVLDVKPRRVTATERRLLQVVADEVMRDMQARTGASVPGS
jgi:predicted PurR-regulated permease PerM